MIGMCRIDYYFRNYDLNIYHPRDEESLQYDRMHIPYILTYEYTYLCTYLRYIPNGRWLVWVTHSLFPRGRTSGMRYTHSACVPALMHVCNAGPCVHRNLCVRAHNLLIWGTWTVCPSVHHWPEQSLTRYTVLWIWRVTDGHPQRCVACIPSFLHFVCVHRCCGHPHSASPTPTFSINNHTKKWRHCSKRTGCVTRIPLHDVLFLFSPLSVSLSEVCMVRVVRCILHTISWILKQYSATAKGIESNLRTQRE